MRAALTAQGDWNQPGFSRQLASLGSNVMIADAQHLSLSGRNDVDNLLVGAAGATLRAGAGDDMLVAGEGDETLIGGNGRNTFVLSDTIGKVVITESGKLSRGNEDIVRVGAGLSGGPIQVVRDGGNDLVLLFGGDRRATISGYFTSASNQPAIVFADGTRWDYPEVAARMVTSDLTGRNPYLYGVQGVNNRMVGAAGDTITAGNLDDTITAGRNNTLNAGAGVDTFIVGKGLGLVTLNETSQKTAHVNQDVVQLGAGITAAGTQIARDVQNNLILSFGDGDQLKIANYFSQSGNGLQLTFADGTRWDYKAITDRLVFTDTTAGNQYLYGLQGVDNRIVGAAGDTIMAGNLNDTITAGRNNTLNAGAGIDTFIVAKGLGRVTLNEPPTKTGGANQDVVQLGAGITAAGTQIARDVQNNLILSFGDGDQLKINGYFDQQGRWPKLVFADGTSWDYAAITSQLVFADTTAGNQYLYGLRGVDNRIVGAAGDTIMAGNLNDTITAGRNNTLNAGAGVDTFIVGKGLGLVTLSESQAKTGGVNQDVVQLGAGITAAGTQIARDLQNNLILNFGDGDQLKISNYFSQVGSRPKLRFSDDTNWDYAAVTDRLVFTDTSAGGQYLYGLQGVSNRIVGAAGDTIVAGNLNDTITAGRNNTLNAGAGVDTFIVGKGLGLVTVNESQAKTGGVNQDVVQLGAGITAAGTQIARDVQNNLILSFGDGDQLKLGSYFNQTGSRPTLVFSDGTSWDYAAITDRLVFTDTSAGNQYLYGLKEVNNRIVGAAGDTIVAGNLNDTITAGRNNTLNAGAGVDTFILNKGLGLVTLNEPSNKTGGANQDVVQLGAGITAASTRIVRDLQNNLVLDFGNGDQLKINGYFSQNWSRPKLAFADGTNWDYAAVTDRLVFTDTSAGGQYLSGLQGVSNRIVGAAGDTIVAGNLNDTITAGRNNTLNAGAGVDTFIIGQGLGLVTLNEPSNKTGGANQDVVQLGTGITAASTRIVRDLQNNLVLDFGNGDQLKINGYFSQNWSRPKLAFADGTSWDYAAVTDRLVFTDTSAGGQYLNGLQGVNNRIVGAAGDTIVAGNLNDTITAGRNNTLNAGAGVDTFIIGQGLGLVTLNEPSNKTGGANQDVVQLGAGITAASTRIVRDLQNNLILDFGSGNQLKINGYFSQPWSRPKLAFADGTSWDYAAITDQLVFADTSAGNQYLSGLQGVDNRIVGAAGDTIVAGNRNDTITAGRNNTLNAGAGVDTFILNKGAGLVTLNEMASKTAGMNQDVVQLGAGITAAGTQIARDLQNNLILSFGGGDQLKITGYFSQPWSRPTLAFADGANWDYAAVTDRLVFADTGAGNQYLYGLQGVNNRIVGAAGDTIAAGNLDDTITAGRNNALHAGAGVDTFVVNKGMGLVTLSEVSNKTGGANQDVVQLGAGITAAGTQIARDPQNNLILSFGDGDQLKIAAYFGQPWSRPMLAFADGTHWDYAAVTDRLVFADTGAGNQYLYGLQGVNNRIVGAAGDTIVAGNLNDTITAGRDNRLTAGAGVDTFVVNPGTGHVSVSETQSKTAGLNQDVVRFGSGVASDQLWLRRVGNDLEMDVIGTTDALTLNGWYGGAGHVHTFEAGEGKVLTDTRVANLVDAMAAFSPPPAGQTSLPAAAAQQLGPVLAASWQKP